MDDFDPELWFHRRASFYVEAQLLYHLNGCGVFAFLAENGPQSVHALALHDDSVLVLNGELAQSWSVDGDAHALTPVRGIAFDAERPIFSSTSSWLLGRNIFPLEGLSWEMAEFINGERSWAAILSCVAPARGADVAAVRKEAVEAVNALAAQELVTLRSTGAL